MAIPPRLAPLLAQFEFEQDRLLTRLAGLTDEEYLWEPVPACWSIRPRGQAQGNRAAGGGGWQIERAHPEPEPPPFTTLAWRLCHLASGTALRADYTIGTRALTWGDYTIPYTAEAGVAALATALAAWHDVLTSATDADLDQVGRSAFPWGLDPTLPLLDICWWVNQELLRHGAEIALLRDLYGAQPRYTPSVAVRPREEAPCPQRWMCIGPASRTSNSTRSRSSTTAAMPGATGWPSARISPMSSAPSPNSGGPPC